MRGGGTTLELPLSFEQPENKITDRTIASTIKFFFMISEFVFSINKVNDAEVRPKPAKQVILLSNGASGLFKGIFY